MSQMTSLTINLEEPLKATAQKKAQKDGVTLTFIVVQALKAYNDGKLKFGLVSEDDEITSSFDVSTKEGKRACIKDFESLVKRKKLFNVLEDLKNLLVN